MAAISPAPPVERPNAPSDEPIAARHMTMREAFGAQAG